MNSSSGDSVKAYTDFSPWYDALQNLDEDQLRKLSALENLLENQYVVSFCSQYVASQGFSNIVCIHFVLESILLFVIPKEKMKMIGNNF